MKMQNMWAEKFLYLGLTVNTQGPTGKQLHHKPTKLFSPEYIMPTLMSDFKQRR